MKVYTKPVMVALSLAGNEQLCGSCADRNAQYLLKNDQTNMAKLIDRELFNGDGTLTRQEAAQLFAAEDNCSMGTMMYCKFTSAITVAWS